MATKNLLKPEIGFPTLFNDMFKPWNDLIDYNRFWGKPITVPPVNIIENTSDYKVTLVAPGLKREDFKIDVNSNLLTISVEKEEKMEEEDEKYTRKEYNYTSFSRSFTMPEEVKLEDIEATYKDGMLMLVLPKKEEARKAVVNKHITVK